MEWNIDREKQGKMEKELGCTFCEDGIFAEMALELSDYTEQTRPLDNIEFGFFKGNITLLRKAVALVDAEWVKYFNEHTTVFGAFADGKPLSFCIIDTDIDYILSVSQKKIGAIGCVGTVPNYRNLGIGLRMVDLATLYLKKEKCDIATISYTHIDKWYAKLGYQTFARFRF